MKTQSDQNSVEPTTANPWRQAARGAAIVAAVFSIVVGALLVWNHLHIKILDPVRAERLEIMKLKAAGTPANELLLSEIRRLDLQIREGRIKRQNFSSSGGVLLAGGLAVLLVAVKLAAAFKKELPFPQPTSAEQSRQLRQAAQGRWAVTVGLAVLGAAAIGLALRGGIDFDRAGAAAGYPSQEQISKNWPRFRGPGGLGISHYTNIPTDFDGKTGRAVLWKSAVPLPGHNSPILWENRIFLSGADKNTRRVYCFDVSSGKLLWTGDAAAEVVTDQGPDVMNDTGYAAPTMATDGQRVYAIFATGDIACFDFDGNKRWERNLGRPESAYGYASSLTTYRNLLLIQYDQATVDDEKSRMFALDGFTGQGVWETKRAVPNSWTSPMIAQIDDKPQLITCGEPWVIAYDPATGGEIWRAECAGGDVAPSPVYAGGLVIVVEPYDKVVAVRPDGSGDVTKTHIAWIVEDGIPDICCPIANDRLIFLLTSDGTLTCYQIKDGKKLYEKELDMNFKASPSLVGDKVYLLSDKGVMLIIEAAGQYKELHRSELGEECFASPVFADGRIYLRGDKNLYCIGSEN